VAWRRGDTIGRHCSDSPSQREGAGLVAARAERPSYN